MTISNDIHRAISANISKAITGVIASEDEGEDEGSPTQELVVDFHDGGKYADSYGYSNSPSVLPDSSLTPDTVEFSDGTKTINELFWDTSGAFTVFVDETFSTDVGFTSVDVNGTSLNQSAATFNPSGRTFTWSVSTNPFDGEVDNTVTIEWTI